MTNNTQAHWDHIYETNAGNELSWFQEHPAISLDLIRATGAKPGDAMIDIGGGESRLVDALLDQPSPATRPTGFWRMGMSADFELAIQLGATHVMIGCAIFGER